MASNLSAANRIYASPKFIFELAAGVEEPTTVALRYGYTVEQYERLFADKAFQKAVEVQRSELKANGYVFRVKSALLAEELLDTLAVQALSEDTPLNQKLEAAKWLAKMGGLEPKEDKVASSGGGFSITINMGDKSVTVGAAPRPKVIDADVIGEVE